MAVKAHSKQEFKNRQDRVQLCKLVKRENKNWSFFHICLLCTFSFSPSTTSIILIETRILKPCHLLLIKNQMHILTFRETYRTVVPSTQKNDRNSNYFSNDHRHKCILYIQSPTLLTLLDLVGKYTDRGIATCLLLPLSLLLLLPPPPQIELSTHSTPLSKIFIKNTNISEISFLFTFNLLTVTALIYTSQLPLHIQNNALFFLHVNLAPEA